MTNQPPTHRMNSSLRTRPISETLVHAKEMGKRMGITRVTDSTPLDRIGIPVYASIRPNANENSLCVSAGKGILPQEAEIGAYMEAIELAFAEEGNSHIRHTQSTIQEMTASFGPSCSVLDFAPYNGCLGSPSDPVEVVEAELFEVGLPTGKIVLAPAECVFLPFDSNPNPSKFGNGHSIGLASGNTVHEASVHALAEAIEHDIESFELIKDTSRLVDPAGLPSHIQLLFKQIEGAQLQIFLRNVSNAFGLPFFQAIIIENSDQAHVNICAGYGVHPIKDIAAVRAVTEAAQSRLSVIHGGRDDLTKYPETWKKLGREAELEGIRDFKSKFCVMENLVSFEDIPDLSAQAYDLDSTWICMASALAAQGMPHIARVVFTQPSDPLQVVKLVIPKLESCSEDTFRFGTRLRAFINEL